MLTLIIRIMKFDYFKNLRHALIIGAGLATVSAYAEVNPYAYQAGDEVTVDNKVYTLGANIVTNPDFADGLNGWTSVVNRDVTPFEYTTLGTEYFEVNATAGPSGGAALVAKASSGSNTPQSVRTPYELTAGKTYYVSFFYKSVGDLSSVYMTATKDSGDEYDGTVLKCENSSDWKQATAIFTPTDATLWTVFNFAWLNANSATFANFYLGEATQTATVDHLDETITTAEDTYAKESLLKGAFAPTEAALAALEAAINTAKGVAADENADSATRIAAAEALEEAVKTFNEAKRIQPVKCEFAADTLMYVKNVWSGNYLGFNWSGGSQCVLILGGAQSADRQLKFVAPEGAAEGQYNLMDANGNVAYKSTGDNYWSLYYKSAEGATLTDPNYLFEIVTIDGVTYLRNMGAGEKEYCAPDDNWAWAPVFGNKSGDAISRAPIEFYSLDIPEGPIPVDYSALKSEIASAKEVAEGAVAGTEVGQYPQDAIDTLNAAIAAAEAVADDEDADQETVDAAADTLKEAVATFKNTLVGPEKAESFAEDTYFYIRNEWSGLWYTAYDNDNKTLALGDYTGNANQQFKFMYVKNADGSNLITGDNRIITQDSWNLNWSEFESSNDYNVAANLFKVEREGDIYYIKSVGKQAYLAPDSKTAGSSIFADKAVNFEDTDGTPKVPVTLWKVANPQDGVYSLAADSDAVRVVYDLNGRVVSSDNLAKGIYIVKEGNNVRKIMVK